MVNELKFSKTLSYATYAQSRTNWTLVVRLSHRQYVSLETYSTEDYRGGHRMPYLRSVNKNSTEQTPMDNAVKTVLYWTVVRPRVLDWSYAETRTLIAGRTSVRLT